MSSSLPVLLSTVAVGLLAWGASAFARVDEPPYVATPLGDGFELRTYPAIVVAEVEVEGDRHRALYDGFRILFDYIGGANTRAETVPMTAPVLEQTGEACRRVGFVMPAGETLRSLPVPTDPRVKLRAVPARRVLVRRFSGTWSEAHLNENVDQLLELVRSHGLTTAGEPVLAFYDRPSTPWFLRRNEVLVDLAPSWS